MFTSDFGTQKLGGFDPYMNEYVFSNNSLALPAAIVPVSCNSTLSKQSTTNVASYTLDLGQSQGVVTFTYTVTGTVTLLVVWDGNSVINQSITGTSTVSFTKNTATPSTATVTITPSGTASFEITPSCPQTSELIIVQMTLGSPADDGKFIHNQYYWTQGSTTSPMSSELIDFSHDNTAPVESWISTTGQSSSGIFPPSGATIKIQSNKKDFDDFVFDPAVDKFKYLVTATAYTESQWATIDAAATGATPITNPSTGLYEASFTYTNAVPVKYLYMIWDYRNPTGISLRYGATTTIACCSGSSSTFYLDTDSFATATAVYTTSTLHVAAADQFYQTGNTVRQQSGGVLLPAASCASCGSGVPLCYSSTSAVDVCCTGCTYSSFSSSIVKSTRTEACGLAQGQTYYHNGTGATPVVNDFVFGNNTGTTILTAGYYSLSATSVIYVNSSGMVENLLTC